MAAPHQIKRLAMEVFHESDDVVIPRLMHEFKVPYRVAAMFPVAPNAIHRWLVERGWYYSAEQKKWIEPAEVLVHE